jgi:hypothetical protein
VFLEKPAGNHVGCAHLAQSFDIAPDFILQDAVDHTLIVSSGEQSALVSAIGVDDALRKLSPLRNR